MTGGRKFSVTLVGSILVIPGVRDAELVAMARG
jgi:hypothetical protein